MLASLGKTAARALAQRMRKSQAALITPGPEVTREFAPLSSELLDAYVANTGGDPRAYRGVVPPHFFPHWAMPVAAETLKGLPYPMLRVLNAGCRMRVNALMPRDEPLLVRARLAQIDDDGKRAILTQHVVTGTRAAPEALVCEIYAFVPLRSEKKDDGAKRERRDKARVPQGAHEIAFSELDARAGLDFAKLTGDFNPIHWVRAYARASGFPNVILHGFGTFARACEALNRGLFGGDVRKLRVLDAKFTRPLVLPHAIGVYVRKREVFVGDGVEGPAYMVGSFEAEEDR